MLRKGLLIITWLLCVSENYYEFSSKTLEEFKKTLETFKKTLIKNKVEKKLNIELKDSYEIEDVIDIAMKLKENHDGVGSVNTCMGKIRSAFRSIRKKKGVMANLLSFAPNDSYGVVLCGGFTVILGVSPPYQIFLKLGAIWDRCLMI